jgi:EAL domain-containing protein (putative c-di-GMP-specific phosphodiesterase class I)/CheY-like chemotaxis protein/GGDEF domain-containing protein
MKRGATGLTVVMIHVPDLTEITDSFGYDVSVEVNRAIAGRLRGVAPTALAAKGVLDQFAVLWSSQPRDDAEIAKELIGCASGVFDVRGVMLDLSAHAAVGRWSVVGGNEPDDLLRATQRALDGAKQSGRAWAAAERLSTDGRSRFEVVSELRSGIAAGELRLHYQPIVELPGRKLRGFEALVRWEHPKRGLVSPGEFIPLAEQSGLIVQLTEWVLQDVMRQMREWDAINLRPQVSVNVGAKAISSLPDVIERLVASIGADPSRLVIEVTESDIMSDPARSTAVLHALKSLGVRTELDDFGTGYSSLAYLRQLPLDGVKIDRSFVRNLLSDANTAAIVRAAIDLSHALGLEAIAEGVETELHLDRLAGSGCDAAQGYLFARPMPSEAVPAWLTITGGSVSETGPEPMPLSLQRKGEIVLLVDDEPKMRLSTHRMLSVGGFQVLAASSASEALQIYAAQGHEIKVVLTDMHLTDWRGHELAARLREGAPQLRVVFMSGDARELSNAGNDQFLVKPFSKRELLESIRKALAV